MKLSVCITLRLKGTKNKTSREIATLKENLTSIRGKLKVKKAELKIVEKDLGKLENQKTSFDNFYPQIIIVL